MNQETGTHIKSDVISEEILKRISSGEWAPGTKLPPERQLVEIFNVSRTSIRKAIASLQGRGILNAVQGDGTYVNRSLPEGYLENALQMVVLDGVNYRDIQEFRLMLEPMIAEKAAVYASKQDLKRLYQCLQSAEAAEAANDIETALEYDFKFHNMLAESVHNQMLTKMTSLITDLTRQTVFRTGVIAHNVDGKSDLRNIYEYVAAHNSDGARSAMWFHIKKDFDDFIHKTEQGAV